MKNEDLFAAALQLSAPWFITKVDFPGTAGTSAARELHIHIDFRKGAEFPCPADGCGKACPVHDTRDLVWRHASFFQFPCYLHVRVPRVLCPDHEVRQVNLPFVRPGSGFSPL
ncbi:transposase family protein [Sutterella sp.]|uniref:transposase family protein n=1 Tax=Sutterella sp. TaxID=1981025 RepID=UPI0026DEFBEE|nr:transposase family protein [Sutterella sp.]MDO5531006.1 transposase family protein [Sutterella sp.]